MFTSKGITKKLRDFLKPSQVKTIDAMTVVLALMVLAVPIYIAATSTIGHRTIDDIVAEVTGGQTPERAEKHA